LFGAADSDGAVALSPRRVGNCSPPGSGARRASPPFMGRATPKEGRAPGIPPGPFFLPKALIQPIPSSLRCFRRLRGGRYRRRKVNMAERLKNSEVLNSRASLDATGGAREIRA